MDSSSNNFDAIGEVGRLIEVFEAEADLSEVSAERLTYDSLITRRDRLSELLLDEPNREDFK